jgi:N-acetylmuramoyl-L-alanine amidase
MRRRRALRNRILAIACATGLLAFGARLMVSRYGAEWHRRLFWPRPPGVIIHHSASSGSLGGLEVDAHTIDRWHARRGFGARTADDEAIHIGYHYVILPDGTIQRGRPEWMRGAHTRGHNNWLGVCLVGNFSSAANPRGEMKPDRPTKAQLDALNHLLVTLARRYNLGPEDIRRHRDFAKTACPGDRFPMESVRARLAGEIAGGKR